MKNALLLLLALLGALTADALEIKDVRWGFDGRVVPDRFAILSVLVENPTAQPFDGQMILEQTQGIGGTAGAPIVQPIYVAPGSARYVQFQPYISDQNTGWHLRWGRDQRDVDAPTSAGPARVFLADPESTLAAAVRMKIFPDDLFPTTVGATDGLAAVVLDHVPRWEVARREAFIDWLHRGGVVHLLRGANGTLPEFTAELAPLNGTADRSRIGAGAVFRHTIARADITEPFLDEHGSPARDLRNGKQINLYAFDQTLLQKLASLTKPRIAWWLVYLLTASYLVVVGPAHFLTGRRMNYRLSILAFLGIVAAYAASFAWAGRRGADETQRVHSISIAHSLGGTRYDVIQWISAFVTHGDLYKLTHAAPSNLYSVGTSDPVHGQILNGRDGILAVDLPLYSSRPFIHRGVMQGDDTSVTVEKWETDSAGTLTALTLRHGPAFPQPIDEMVLKCVDQFFTMIVTGDRFTLRAPEPADTFFANVSQEIPSPWMTTQEGDQAAWLRKSIKTLIARDLGGAERMPHEIPPPALAPDEALLYILTRAPAGFHLRGGDFASENGTVLYVQKITKPEP